MKTISEIQIELIRRGYDKDLILRESVVNLIESSLPSLHTNDTILMGHWQNREAKIKGFKRDKNNQPVAKTNKGDVNVYKFRLKKLMKESESIEKIGIHYIEDSRDRKLTLLHIKDDTMTRYDYKNIPALVAKQLKVLKKKNELNKLWSVINKYPVVRKIVYKKGV